MRHYKYFKLLVIILIAGFVNVSYAQSLDDIVAKHITAMGGADKLSKLKSVKISANMEVMNMEMPVTTTIVQDKGFRTETTAQGMTIVQAVNGNTGWMINPMAGQDKATALPEDVVKTMVSQTDLTGLYNYKQKGYTLALEGEQDIAGAKTYKVVMTLKNGIRQENYISKDTFYILKIVATVPMNGQDIKTESLQSDFKQIDGITFPFSSEVTTTAMPGMSMVNKIASVEINPKIDDSIFDMPN
ncbi:outer membrane lipoprotein-sorting protein [Dyadobacter sp. NIV53]|uniref:outer membrane lipoprotein-sorting protein n=1 Tax=Dyadobacter sp. NIV53 TaxID=2861765 RepID=UPI001C8762BE|nr:outer membrane lipoprotein-sorting protein [Dyadobacter sp. NIV53]